MYPLLLKSAFYTCSIDFKGLEGIDLRNKVLDRFNLLIKYYESFGIDRVLKYLSHYEDFPVYLWDRIVNADICCRYF